MKVTQLFTLEVTEPVDLAVAVTSASFQGNCQSSVAMASRRQVEDIEVIGASLVGGRRTAGGRRLAEGASEKEQILLQYRIPVRSSAEQADVVATLQTPRFAQEFTQQVISAEQASQGLRISQVDFERLSINSTSFTSSGGNDTEPILREVVGNALDLYGNPLWNKTTLAAWANNATPAIQAALVRTLSTPAIPASVQTVSVSPGAITITPSYARARFHVHAQVPQLKTVVEDPNGSVYRERSQSYYLVITHLGDSEPFHKTVLEELHASGVPPMPGMAFAERTYSAITDEKQSASVSVYVVVLMLLLTAVFVFLGTLSWIKRPRCCGGYRVKGHGKPQMQERHVDDDRVKPFHDECVCGEEIANGADACGKCGRKSALGEVSIDVHNPSLSKLRFALQEIGEASKSFTNEYAVTSPTASNAVPSFGNRKHQDAMTNGMRLPDLMEATRRKLEPTLDYTERPPCRAAKRSQDNLDDAGHVISCLAKPSPTSTRATELPDGADSLEEISPQRSNWSSPQRSRPSTRRASPSPSNFKSESTARSHDQLSTSHEMIEVIDVTDTESEDSGGTPLPMLKHPSEEGILRRPSQERGALVESRSFSNWTSMRLFRRTMASYFVAEQGSPPPTPPKPNPNSLPIQGQNKLHGLSARANRPSHSDRLDVIEVTDL